MFKSERAKNTNRETIYHSSQILVINGERKDSALIYTAFQKFKSWLGSGLYESILDDILQDALSLY
jgi:hypothetical protein